MAQWNISEKWDLAGKSDIGGFGVGSDFVWTIQGSIGYNFTEKVSADQGYRYMQTDYSKGDFTYDVATAGIYTSLNFNSDLLPSSLPMSLILPGPDG